MDRAKNRPSARSDDDGEDPRGGVGGFVRSARRRGAASGGAGRRARGDALSALSIASIYFVFSIIYIAFSDHAVERMLPPELHQTVQTAKGGAFVAISALLIGLLIWRALRRARRRESDYRLLFDESPAGILLASPDGRIFTANPAAEAMLLRSREELMMLGLDCLVEGDACKQLKPWLSKAAHEEGEGPLSGEITLRRSDGESLAALISARRFASADGRESVCLILRDISSLKHLQEQLRHAERLQAVGQLAGGIAHDFNNLLTAIVGNAEVLRDSLEPGNPRQRAEAIIYAGERGSELTRRLLAFARRQILEPQPVEVNGLLRNLDLLIDRVLREKVWLVYSLGEALPEVYVDAAQLETAVLNLITNARDASPAGGRLEVTSALTVFPARPERRAVLVRVRDEGSGMPPEVVARATEPFFTTKPVGEGSGLGLSMVYGFVEQSGGEFQVDSSPDEGTAISLYLPLYEDELLERGGEPDREPEAAESASPAAS